MGQGVGWARGRRHVARRLVTLVRVAVDVDLREGVGEAARHRRQVLPPLGLLGELALNEVGAPGLEELALVPRVLVIPG